MLKIEKFDGTKTYMYPNGEVATPERIRADFPAVDLFPHVIEVNGDVCQAVMALSACRHHYNVPDEIIEEGATIQFIQDKINTPEPEPEPTAEERIAASLEFQNMMML